MCAQKTKNGIVFFKYPRVDLPAMRVNLPAFFWRDHFCTIDHITDRLEYSQVKETKMWKWKHVSQKCISVSGFSTGQNYRTIDRFKNQLMFPDVTV